MNRYVMANTGKAPIPTKRFGKVQELLKPERAGALDGFLLKVYVIILALVCILFFVTNQQLR